MTAEAPGADSPATRVHERVDKVMTSYSQGPRDQLRELFDRIRFHDGHALIARCGHAPADAACMVALPKDDRATAPGGDREHGVRVIDLDAVLELGVCLKEKLMDAVSLKKALEAVSQFTSGEHVASLRCGGRALLAAGMSMSLPKGTDILHHASAGCGQRTDS